jgi:phospholipid/cholesterol/gamma-HCH transport system substrate-binding protein
VLKVADPVLAKARPVISDLREVLKDARPTVDKLNPTLDHGIDTFDNLRGGVLDRLDGPIADAVNNPWHGTGVYKNGGSPNKGYEEVGYLAVVGALGWQTHDGNGDIARLAASGGGQTVGGSAFPHSMEEYLQDLGLVKHKGPQADRPGPTPGPLSLEAPR